MAHLAVFGFALWFGTYLLQRDYRKPGLRFAGFGLIAYALSLAFDWLFLAAPSAVTADVFARLRFVAAFAPVVFWQGAVIHLLPQDIEWQQRARQVSRDVLPLAVAAFCLLAYAADLNPEAPFYRLLAVVAALLLLAAVLLVAWSYRAQPFKQQLGVLLAATLFFALGVGLLLFPLPALPPTLVLIAIGMDLAVLGLVVVGLDAFEEGHVLRLDFVRSFSGALLLVLLFAGQVALLLQLAGGDPFVSRLAVLMVTATAIVIQTFADRFQQMLDGLIFRYQPGIRQARQDLRLVASALPLRPEAQDLLALDEDTFTRLARQAISHFGDLKRLSVSPLIHLPLIDRRLNDEASRANTLRRAAELKAILAESIARLKPHDDATFGTGDEWRYYSALYYVYVLGIKPYNRRAGFDGDLTEEERAALDWLRQQVPERTLYNWQTAAARLVAQDLREMCLADADWQ